MFPVFLFYFVVFTFLWLLSGVRGCADGAGNNTICAPVCNKQAPAVHSPNFWPACRCAADLKELQCASQLCGHRVLWLTRRIDLFCRHVLKCTLARQPYVVQVYPQLLLSRCTEMLCNCSESWKNGMLLPTQLIPLDPNPEDKHSRLSLTGSQWRTKVFTNI